MSSDALLEEISSVKISVLQPNSHPLYQKMLPKHPIAVLEIPNRLFLLWSDLKSTESQERHASGTEEHGSKHLNLLKNSLQDDENLALISPSDTLETRLRKECSRVCKKYHGLRWGPKDRFKESSTLIMVFENEGTLPSTETSNLVPKLQING